jgi:hypothetical protein
MMGPVEKVDGLNPKLEAGRNYGLIRIWPGDHKPLRVAVPS